MNDFEVMDQTALDFDDLRSCKICKHTCIFSAVICECDSDSVACIRHATLACKCPRNKKHLLGNLFNFNLID